MATIWAMAHGTQAVRLGSAMEVPTTLFLVPLQDNLAEAAPPAFTTVGQQGRWDPIVFVANIF